MTELQRRAALERANYIRMTSLRAMRELAALPAAEGRARAAALLRQPTDAVARVRVGKLLCSVRGVGGARARALLVRAGLPRGAWNRLLGPTHSRFHDVLTARQRTALADALERSTL